MRTRNSIEQKKKREEKMITAELKMKYATYIDLIPDLKDLPYFDLLFVERGSRCSSNSRPVTLPVAEKNKNNMPKRFSLPYRHNQHAHSSGKTNISGTPKIIEDRVATLKRTWSSSNISEISTTTSAETSEAEDDTSSGCCRPISLRREFTSTVSSESLKLTIKLKQPIRERLPSSSSETSEDSSLHTPASPRPRLKGVRSSARLRTGLSTSITENSPAESSSSSSFSSSSSNTNTPTGVTTRHQKHNHRHRHYDDEQLRPNGDFNKKLSKRNRIRIQKKCACCH